MSVNPTPRNEALTSSPSAERENSRLPVEDNAVISHEPESSNGKQRGKKAKTRRRKGKTGTITLDSSAERENHGSPVDVAIVPHEPEGIEGNGMTTSNPSAENAASESPVDLSIVPHDPEGTNGQTTCEKVKKRGRHFDREVRAKILQVCISLFGPPFVFLLILI
jgi:snRNA-activating protein complex subunit 3